MKQDGRNAVGSREGFPRKTPQDENTSNETENEESLSLHVCEGEREDGILLKPVRSGRFELLFRPLILRKRGGLEKPQVLVLGETVGHAGDVIAGGLAHVALLGELKVARGQGAGMGAEFLEHLADE